MEESKLKDIQHINMDTYTTNEIKTTCSCGAHWSHPINRTAEEINNIYLAHVKYFNKVLSTVL
jgi:hypothetical protein